MNNLPIDRATFEEAKNTLIQINPCLDAVNALAANNYFTEADKDRLVDFQRWLSSSASKSQDIYNAGQKQYNERPQAKIRAAFAMADNLKKEINLLTLTNSSLSSRYAEKTNELIKQRFSPAEILKIIPPPDQQIQKNDELAAILQNKFDRLWAFATDVPAYNSSRITDIDLGGYLETAEYDLARRSA